MLVTIELSESEIEAIKKHLDDKIIDSVTLNYNVISETDLVLWELFKAAKKQEKETKDA